MADGGRWWPVPGRKMADGGGSRRLLEHGGGFWPLLARVGSCMVAGPGWRRAFVMVK